MWSAGSSERKRICVPLQSVNFWERNLGTNPATAAMTGYQVINIPSNESGCVDIDALRAAVGEDTAGLMLTCPNMLGLFERNICEITRIVHEAGGLNYYDGANLNAVMGVVRPVADRKSVV